MLWEAATAIGTVAMSAFTYGVIRQTRQQRQDGARPILLLTPFDGVIPASRPGLLGPRSVVSPSENTHSFQICCALNNVGVGPALHVLLQLRFMNRDDYGISRELAPLGAGEARGDAQHPLSLPVTLSTAFNETDFTLAAGTGWTMVLEYQDVFGNRFHTLHASAPQLPWVVYGNGPAPAGFRPAPVQVMEAHT